METCDGNFFQNLIFDPWWNLHNVLNERKVVDHFSKMVVEFFLFCFLKGQKGVRRILWTTSNFSLIMLFQWLFKMCVFFVEWKVWCYEVLGFFGFWYIPTIFLVWCLFVANDFDWYFQFVPQVSMCSSRIVPSGTTWRFICFAFNCHSLWRMNKQIDYAYEHQLYFWTNLCNL
jgi:hypothetical protein